MKSPIKRIAITGGSGYIGSCLAKNLSKVYNVRILDITGPPAPSNNRIQFRRCDIRNLEQVKTEVRDVDLVIHTAIVQIPSINHARRLGYEVNVLGTNNVCSAVQESSKTQGLILAGSWHTIGERELEGTIDEEFGFRPDKVEERAKLYALSKIAQECIVRYYDEMSKKIFGVIRMGTVLGDGMPEKTAANIFIENALAGKPLTPFKHSMYRPMLYVDIDDVCIAYQKFVHKILSKEIENNTNSLEHVINVIYPIPITILELAKMVKDAVESYSGGRLKPSIQIVDQGIPTVSLPDDKYKIRANINKALKFLSLKRLKSPRESIQNIVKKRIAHMFDSKTYA
jgi:UDP-glucose 4-epimerase